MNTVITLSYKYKMSTISEKYKDESGVAMTPEEDIEKNRDIAAFSYILLFAPVLIITRRDSAFIKHHALQAVYLLVFFVLFAILPGKLSYINILVVAGALMGFLEAQNGKFYKLPIIHDLIIKRITLQSVFEIIRNGFYKLCNIVKRTFTEGPGFAVRGTTSAIGKARGIDAIKVNKKVEEMKNELDKTEHIVEFLERELLLEKYLKKGALPDLSEEEKKELLETQKIVMKLAKGINENAYDQYVSWKTDQGEVIAGAFSANAFWIFFSHSDELFKGEAKALKNAKVETISFGTWNGVEIPPKNFETILAVIKILSEKTLSQK